MTASCAATKDKEWFYVCSSSNDPHGGIQLVELDAKSGQMRSLGLMAPLRSALFLAIHPNQRNLYATCQIDKRASTGDSLTAFEINQQTGGLTPLNHQSTAGANPCHICFDRDGRHALVSNFNGGNVAVLPIGADGRLAPATTSVTRAGSGADPDWQAGPHPHQAVLDAANRLAYVPDLGLDRVLAYRYDATDGKLTAVDALDVVTAPAAGPRHMVFHPNRAWAYVINQLNSTIAFYQFDSKTGTLAVTGVQPTLPDGFKARNDAAEIIIHPSGRFLYGSNRGHDSIAVFSIDQASGRLAILGQHPAGGHTPTSICFDAAGKLLLSANLDSENIVTHAIDLKTGRLSQTKSCRIARPICIVPCSCLNSRHQ
jgi:6-phosphogluconolactonase